MSQHRVDFFIAGVQKAGTTALDAMLRGHPDIQMARTKEVHFFDGQNTWPAPDISPLHRNFDWDKQGVVRGEATPIYLYWRDAMARIRAYNPSARIVIGLRHPSFRAYSHWRMEVSRNRESLSFMDAISIGRERVAAEPHGQHRTFSYVERGFYAPQIQTLKELFPTDHMYFYRSDALWNNPHGVLASIERFLGVRSFLSGNLGKQQAREVSTGSMKEEERLFLHELYEPTLASLGDLTNLDLADWRDPNYCEPMTLQASAT